jgi:hypothetical protein
MTNTIIQWFRSHEKLSVFIVALIFIGIRLPGTNLPLHQDEYKWPKIVNPAVVGTTEIPHPPLSQFLYRTAGELVGYDVDFRFVPLFFGTLNLLLLFYFLRMRWGKTVAFVGATLFTVSYFSVLASLMVDTDGQIMPFFFLLALISYYKLKLNEGRKKLAWIALLTLSCIAGFFVKVSFVLAILAVVADFVWERKNNLSGKDIIRYMLFGLGALGILAILLFFAQLIFPFFNLSTAFTYWKHFIQSNRNWFQTFIQVIKAFLYSSPFLIGIPFFLSKEKRQELRPCILYIVFGLIFYVILFDFSIGALDRYMQYLIVPLCALSAVALVSIWKSDSNMRNREFLFFGAIIAVALVFLAGLSHDVPPLHPKSEWLNRLISFRWNFLYPFSGGSGPLGFYVSFLFMGLAWLLSFALLSIGFFKAEYRKKILLILIPIGLVYNGLFIEEYIAGKLYGSAPQLVLESVAYIKGNPDIFKVVVYNDNGGDEIQAIGKYERRLYVAPQFEGGFTDAFSNFRGHLLFIDVPRIDPASLPARYIASCTVIYEQQQKYITAKILDCSHNLFTVQN